MSNVVKQSKIEEFTAAKDGLGEVHETVFHLSEQNSLYVRTQRCEPQAREYFCHQIARTPSDLRVHVQRINFEVKRKEIQAVYSALLDLFIALQAKGLPIRQRMLEKSNAFLTDEQIDFLSKHMETGVRCDDRAPYSDFSVLTKAVSGHFNFIERAGETTDIQPDAMVLANEYLEFGQIDQAIAVLEQCIITQPSSLQQQGLLLEIHRSLRQRYVFQKSRKMLVDNKVEMIPDWHELYRELLLGDLK